jgi:4-hydroxy-tetrahydrodipicolinate synthase
MAATPFMADGAIDEPAFRALLRRQVESGCGVYVGSGGSGEGHSLTLDELRRLYQIAVEECAGKVRVCANPPEQRTALAMLRICEAAASCAIELIQIYQLDAGHGMRPTIAEQVLYYRTILNEMSAPIALSVHFLSGYVPPVELIHELTKDYPQIVAINAIGLPLDYFEQLKLRLRPDIAFFVLWNQASVALPLGAAGFLASEPNIAPFMCRAIAEHFARGDMDKFSESIADLTRLSEILHPWARGNPRWLKMCLKILGLPGGNGVLRPPYVLPPDDEITQLATALAQFGLSRLEQAARRLCNDVRQLAIQSQTHGQQRGEA